MSLECVASRLRSPRFQKKNAAARSYGVDKVLGIYQLRICGQNINDACAAVQAHGVRWEFLRNCEVNWSQAWRARMWRNGEDRFEGHPKVDLTDAKPN
jgi:hypothetical protein